MSNLVSLMPADHLLTLEGLYKRYGLDEKAQVAIEQAIVEKYGINKDDPHDTTA